MTKSIETCQDLDDTMDFLKGLDYKTRWIDPSMSYKKGIEFAVGIIYRVGSMQERGKGCSDIVCCSITQTFEGFMVDWGVWSEDFTDSEFVRERLFLSAGGSGPIEISKFHISLEFENSAGYVVRKEWIGNFDDNAEK